INNPTFELCSTYQQPKIFDKIIFSCTKINGISYNKLRNQKRATKRVKTTAWVCSWKEKPTVLRLCVSRNWTTH
ncbi:MAG: hypothetical protein IJU65_04980, partial [Desulfovibrio sp.]|nr:hypothetical protein [Desulfovibrio sp.]